MPYCRCSSEYHWFDILLKTIFLNICYSPFAGLILKYISYFLPPHINIKCHIFLHFTLLFPMPNSKDRQHLLNKKIKYCKNENVKQVACVMNNLTVKRSTLISPQIHWRWNHYNACLFYQQHICEFGGLIVLAEIRF